MKVLIILTALYTLAYGGTKVNMQDSPWLASVNVLGIRTSAATIISTKWAVTASSCVHDLLIVSVTLGVGTNQCGINIDQCTEYAVNNIISYGTPDSIALIQVVGDITFGSNLNVRAIKLDDTEPQFGQTCNVTSCLLGCLQSAEIYVRSVTVCKPDYPFVELTSAMTCAGGPNLASCQGDRGGPLTSNNVLIAITDYLNPLCTIGAQIYIRIAFYTSWIKKITGIL